MDWLRRSKSGQYFGRRFDERLGLRARVGLAAAREATDRPHGHVVIAQNLAREPDAGRLFAPSAVVSAFV